LSLIFEVIGLDIILFFTAIEVVTQTQENPAFDFSPCSFIQGKVKCEEIPVKEINLVFLRTAFPTLASVELSLQSYKISETLIPENLLGNKRVSDIAIGYSSNSVVNQSLSLQVDPNAFQSTKTYTKSFTLSSVDCSLFDLSFLAGFDKITDLSFINVWEIQQCLPSLPPLKSLTSLYIKDCNGMTKISEADFPILVNGLKSVTLNRGEYNNYFYWPSKDPVLHRIMNWLLVSSADTLGSLVIGNMTKLFKIPEQISLFKALTTLVVVHTNITTIDTGALSFSHPIYELELSNNKIEKIEPGAIQGMIFYVLNVRISKIAFKYFLL